MIVGTCSIKLILYNSSSLKEKRNTIKSIIGKIRVRFNVSIAEVGLNDNWKNSVIGFACVTNDTGHANRIISQVLNFIDGNSKVEIIDYNIEIL